VTEPTIEELAAQMDRAHVETKLLERQLDSLEPRTRWSNTPGPEVDRRRFPNDGDGAVRHLHATVTARRDYLMGRYEEMTARAARRAEAHERRCAGMSRFIPGRFGLDALTAPELERQLQVWMTAGSTGLSVGGAEEHADAMREIRGGPKP
jgi:hypothetical protein